MSERNGGFTFSDHAWDRMKAMGLTRADVLPVLLDPEQTYDQGDIPNPGRVYQRGELAAVVKERGKVLVTVIWRDREKWENRPNKDLPR